MIFGNLQTNLMFLKVIGSGSRGNCYLFETDSEVLIWEAGMKLIEVKKALDFDLSKIVGCIVGHIHSDHFSSAKEFVAAGISVYTSQGTIDASGIKSHLLFPVKHKVSFKLGSFTIMPFNIIHDAPEPFGFLIHNEESGMILAFTDTHYLQYTFPNLSQILCESNYSNDIVDAKLIDGSVNAFVRNRVLTSHMEFEVTKDFLRANDLTNVSNIVLVHLSEGNSNEKLFKKEITEITGKQVHIATKGLVINFDKCSF